MSCNYSTPSPPPNRHWYKRIATSRFLTTHITKKRHVDASAWRCPYTIELQSAMVGKRVRAVRANALQKTNVYRRSISSANLLAQPLIGRLCRPSGFHTTAASQNRTTCVICRGDYTPTRENWKKTMIKLRLLTWIDWSYLKLSPSQDFRLIRVGSDLVDQDRHVVLCLVV